jgi:hypothetical protein
MRAGPVDVASSFLHAGAVLDQLPTLTPRDVYDLVPGPARRGRRPGLGITAKESSAKAERAMAALPQAIAAGCNNVVQMRADAYLDAHRPCEHFNKLLTELERRNNCCRSD